jgi:predicted nucleic acid-binding protein
MISVEPGLVDTNVIVYSINADAPDHASSRALLEAARIPSTELYVSSQIICELYSVITSARRVAAPCSPREALQVLSAILTLPGIRVLPIPAEALTALLEILRVHPLTGGDVFDAQIVATMKANNIQRIYTFNAEDFEVFPELSVVVPGVSDRNRP